MSKTWKKYRVLLAAGGMAVCMTAGLGMGIHWSRNHTEKEVVQAAENELVQKLEELEKAGIWYPAGYGFDENCLYKDAVRDEDVAKEVCEKYNLDYDTVLDKDITREMRNYEEALWLIKDMGDCPLLESGVNESDGKTNLMGMSSLEIYICDIYAFGDGAEVIKEACAEFGVDPEKAVVSDLTTEQLIEIGEKAYDTSDHPKN